MLPSAQTRYPHNEHSETQRDRAARSRQGPAEFFELR